MTLAPPFLSWTCLPFLILAHTLVLAPSQPPACSHRRDWDRMQRVLEYMQARLDQELPLTALAAVAQMSPYHFSRLFRQSTGLSPHQYILQQRIAWATRLLVEPQLSVAAIAKRVGFASQAHFTTIFRRWLGTTPRQYRQQR
jgi:AraC family transcriptional regulator